MRQLAKIKTPCSNSSELYVANRPLYALSLSDEAGRILQKTSYLTLIVVKQNVCSNAAEKR